jgi:hypothetical protein
MEVPLILTFSDWNYRPILENWLCHLADLGIQGARVYCLDAKTMEWCRARSVDAELLVWDGNFAGLWQRRLEVFNDLIAKGTEFIHSDADAIWLRNPLAPDSAARQPVDLVFSQGTVWPPDVCRTWGFVLCCGWFWVKPTSSTQSFFRDLVRDVEVTRDDQVSVNRLLSGRGIRWENDGRADYAFLYKGNRVHCWLSALQGRTPDGSLSVAMLPQHQYQRVPRTTDHAAVVKHFVSPKNCESKIVALRSWGLWKLDQAA